MGGWGGGCVMNWEIGIDRYTLICIKWMTNKNLLYKKLNKIKFKKKINKINKSNDLPLRMCFDFIIFLN